MKRNYIISGIISLSLSVALISCGGNAKQDNSEEQEKSATEEKAAEDAAKEQEAENNETEELTVPEDARVFFANLQSGDEVSSPLELEFGVEGMEVEPAGELNQGKGHHHIIINGGFLDQGTVVPSDSLNIHYGKGQTSTTLELPQGKHTLTMQFADGYHQSYGEQMSATIEVVVK